MSVSSRPLRAPAPPSVRIEWIDAARGTAMLLLLVWHAASIPEVLGTSMPRAFETANDGLHLLRMPLLMFLSGMVADRALTRSLAPYYRRKAATLLWPYTLWGLLDLITFEHQPLTSAESWNGTGYLWFLFYVLAFSLVAPLLRRVPPAVIALVAVGASATLHAGFPDDDMLFYAGLFFAGLAAARAPSAFARLLGSPPLVAVFALAGAVMCVAWATGVRPNEGFVAPFALGGVVATVAVVSRIRSFPAPVAGIGRRSIVWYLAHFPLMHLTVWSLQRTGLDVPWVVMFVANLAVALTLCPLLVRLADRTPVRYLFSAPPPLGEPVRTRAAAV